MFLISFYKPLLILAAFVPWAWLVSSRLEKDARYYKLPYRHWNAGWLASAVAALAAMVFVPIFWIGWPIGLLILAGPLYAYMLVRNRAVPEKAQFEFSQLLRRGAAKPRARATAATVQFMNVKGAPRPVPAKDDPRLAVHMAAEDLLVPALEARAARLEVAVSSRGTVVVQVIDGMRFRRDPLAPETAMAVIDYLKEAAGLNVEDRRRRQTAEFRMSGPMGQADLSLVTAGSSAGQEMRLLFNRAKQVMRPIDNLGLMPAQLEAIRAFEQSPERHGVFLFGAPAGHGLTTTGYSLIGRHDAYTSNVKTLEREVQARHDGVDHVQWDPANPDVDYATHLQSILRRDPDVVLVADLTEPETARTASEPGMQGPLLYIPQRAASIADQVRDWIKLVGDVKRAIKALRVVMNQRLLRTLCPNCRQPYEPSAEQLRRLNLPADRVKQLFQANGKVEVKNKIEACPICAGSGYFGQTGIFQIMIVNEEIRTLLAAGDLKGALAEARRNKMIYLQEAAMRKVVEGTTAIDEVVRVLAPPRPAEGAKRAAPDVAPDAAPDAAPAT
jgi:type II secretory ATPase GspE/PulE/Tfp pilus assembly ATPase PilB-like protein